MRAFNLYHSVDGDLSLREDVLRQYLPQVSFVDHSPQQLPHDEELDVTAAELLRGLPLSQMDSEINEINPDSAFLPSVQEMATLEEEEESVSDSVVEAVAAVMAKLSQSNNRDEEIYRSVSFAGAAGGISFDNSDS